jgi:hypothetical protein
MKVLSVERTFWEKATILHAEFHRPADKAMPERFSRHYSDFYELIHKGVSKSATPKLTLLARVAEHKNLFFKSSWAKYGEAAKGTLRVVPPEHRLKTLREDYQKMQQMFFGEQPEFDKIIALLNQWEFRVQSLLPLKLNLMNGKRESWFKVTAGRRGHQRLVSQDIRRDLRHREPRPP